MTTDPWIELLEAARESHPARHDQRSCRMCAALSAFPATLSLFEAPPAAPKPLSDMDAQTIGAFRKSDPATSRTAAILNFPTGNTQRRRIFDFALGRETMQRHGITTSEITVALGYPHQTASRRITDLVQGGWLEDSGRTRRSLSSKRDQTVWVVTERGMAKANEAAA